MSIEKKIKQKAEEYANSPEGIQDKLVNFSKFKLIELDQLVKAEWNYKVEDEDKTEKLTANIKRNGQIENLIVRELDTGYYEVCNGNHRLDVFKQLGIEKAVCYNLGKISAQEAKRKTIETNETKFQVDNIKLAETMKDVLSAFGVADLVKTMPYSEEEIVNLEKLVDFDFSQYDKESEEAEKDPKEYTCPKCGHTWEE